jgi:hypothetical protein
MMWDSGVTMRVVMLCVLALLLGCGGKTRSHPHGDAAGGGGQAGSGAGDGSGGTRAIGGTQATGGTSVAGGTPNASCPKSVPERGVQCDGDLVCTYITARKECCSETAKAACVDGAWDISELDCDCPVGTGGATTGTGEAAGAMPDSWFECETSDDCTRHSASCCGECGVYTSDDVIATNRDGWSSYIDAMCGTDYACDACYTNERPSITAVCREGRCTVVDLSQDPMTACTRNEDCRVRTKDCCECGGHLLDLVAVATSAESSYAELVCEEGTGCDDCTELYAETARCLDGHCAVYDGPSDTM